MRPITICSILLTLSALFLSGCGSSDGNAKNMEQIYLEEGVPVKVKPVQFTSFSKQNENNAELTGLVESSAFAAISDKIDKILYEVGDFVKKDDIVLTFPTDNPAAKYYQAKVSYENALALFERMKSYFETGGLSQQNFDNARTQYEVAKADWDAVQQSVLVRAPISGTVTKINVRESDNVNKDDELFTVSRTDKMKTKIWITEKQICDFRVNQPATAEWNGTIIEGRVAQVDMSLNKERQAFGVVLEFDNPGNRIRCGVTARVKVDTYSKAETVVVERKNVLRENQRFYVYVAVSDVCERHDVTLGESNGTEVEITAGLRPGDALIVEGQLHLVPGSKIRVMDDEDKLVTENN
ncbi:MAG: efflux RND transporter periplasmic adaptor subunit [candidate division Zixibacteria bacterium]|nr:efflux RND transporter periplasmic adaptor subunit [candidate division Zixibacteria bacterium]